ncbi:MAG: hypothetical protein NC405_06485 [Odoribacter sp.]|nr:hypothetical protein [Odoribacter sp.]
MGHEKSAPLAFPQTFNLNQMLTTYTKEEMLTLWRRALGFDESRTDCTVEQYDGRSVNDTITEAMRAWYLNHLDTANPGLLPVDKVSTTTVTEGHSLLRIKPSKNCRRPLEVTAARWNTPAFVAPCKLYTPMLARLSSPYSTITESQPVAVLHPDGRSILAAPLDEGDAFIVEGVTDPDEDTYIIDDSLLTTIPDTI